MFETIKNSSVFKTLKSKYKKAKHIIDHLVITLITLALIHALITFLGSWGEKEVIKFASDSHNWLNNHETITKIVVTVLLVSYLEIRKARRDTYEKGKIANNIGLFYSSNNVEENARKESDAFLTKRAMKAREIWISGATGYETFANGESPLTKAMDSAGAIKIMLLSPLSDEAIKTRANDLKVNHVTYKEEIIKSLNFLRELKSKHPLKTIEVKLYKSYPFWKYIFLCDKYVWVQQYPYRDHVKNAPGYAFQKLKIAPCVYSHMEEQFKRRFESRRFGVYDLKEDTLTYENEVIKNITEL